MKMDINMNIGSAIHMGKKLLSETMTVTPDLDSEVLLAMILNMSRTDLFIHRDLKLTEKQLFLFREAIEKRCKSIPVAYIAGVKEFMSLKFKVGPECLIPRPETEVLVERIIDIMKSSGIIKPLILEIGTGSGCISVSLAKYVNDCHVVATDISSDALRIAEWNAKIHGVSGRIDFRKGDVYNAVGESLKFDFILSNPPYVSNDEFQSLQNAVKDNEPFCALCCADDGLLVTKSIIERADTYLKKNGLIAIEINPRNNESVENIFVSNGYKITGRLKDLNRFIRVLIAERQEVD